MRKGQLVKVLSPGLRPLYRECVFIKYKSRKSAVVSLTDNEGYMTVSLSRILPC